jgi:hypothetical protein
MVARTPAYNQQIIEMTAAREALSELGLNREQQDTELLRLARARKIMLIPSSNQKVLEPEDYAAEIMFGNQRKGAVMIP